MFVESFRNLIRRNMQFLIPTIISFLIIASIQAQSNDENLEHKIAGGIGEGAQHAADGVTYVRDQTGRLVNAAGQKINDAGEAVGEAAENMKDDLSKKADAVSNSVGEKLENKGREMQGKTAYNSATSLSFAASLLTFIVAFSLL